MIMVSGLAAQAGIMRTLGKVIDSPQSSKHPKDPAKPPFNVVGVCVPGKERSSSNYTSYVPILERKEVTG
jgi:hypothetical protein